MPIYKLNDRTPILPANGRYWVAPDPAASSYAASRYASCRANA